MKITHKKIATLPDEPGVEINKGEWNDDHAIASIVTVHPAASGDLQLYVLRTADTPLFGQTTDTLYAMLPNGKTIDLGSEVF